MRRRPWWRAPQPTTNGPWREFLYGLMIGGAIMFFVWLVVS